MDILKFKKGQKKVEGEEIGEGTIGYIGLGQMGNVMAHNLLKIGFKVKGFDINPKAGDELVKVGGEKANSIEEILDTCDTVVTVLVSEACIKTATTQKSNFRYGGFGGDYLWASGWVKFRHSGSNSWSRGG